MMLIWNSCFSNIVTALSITYNDCDLTWHVKCKILSKEKVDYLKEADNILKCRNSLPLKEPFKRLEAIVNSGKTDLFEIK